MTTGRTITIGAETVQVRRISWAEFYRIRPDLKPANDNEKTGWTTPSTHPARPRSPVVPPECLPEHERLLNVQVNFRMVLKELPNIHSPHYHRWRQHRSSSPHQLARVLENQARPEAGE